MRALALAVVLLVASAGAAHAQRGLSLAEKDETRKGYNAHAQVVVAWGQFATALSLSTGASAKTALKDLWGFVHYFVREVGLGNILLIGINDAPPETALIFAREAIPRAQWVLDAFAHHDAALGNYTLGIASADAAFAVTGQVAGYYTAVTAVKNAFIAMQGYLAGLNRSLPYLQARNLPYCRDAARAANTSSVSQKNGACNVIGPHGNWIFATQQIALGLQEIALNMGPDNLRKVYTAYDGAEAALPDSVNPVIADILVAMSKLLENLMIVAYNFAVIPVTPTQCGFTPFHLVSRTIERSLQFGDTTESTTAPAAGGPIAGNPFYFTLRGNLQTDLDALATAFGSTHPLTHQTLNAVLSSILLSWRFSEGGFWSAFEMPSDIYNVIVGNAESGGPAFGTTVFPYYFGVTRGSQLRVYVRNAGSSGNKAPLVEGVDYTVTGLGNPAGGTITFTTPPPLDFHVQIERVGGTRLEESRLQPYPENDPAVGTVGPCS